jgi:hypothetical protein
MPEKSSIAPFVSSLDAVPHLITWIGGAAPAEDEARAVWEAITQRRLATDREVAAYVAELLFRRDLAAVGAESDIGYFQRYYDQLAWYIVTRLDGILVRIGGRAPWIH